MAAGEMTTRQAWSKSWDVNVTGAHLMTSAIVPLLFKSPAPRLIFVTSGPSSLSESEDPANKWNYSPPAGWPKTHVFGKVVLGYRCAKTGLNMLAREWTRLLKNDPVKVLCVSPGFMATKLNRMPPEKLKMIGAVDPIVGGNFLKDVVEGKKDNAEGKVIRQNGIQPW
jgi:NAD(P)-dependent dehydrogenase (short-subunit alcohol dehydrogenase family)